MRLADRRCCFGSAWRVRLSTHSLDTRSSLSPWPSRTVLDYWVGQRLDHPQHDSPPCSVRPVAGMQPGAPSVLQVLWPSSRTRSNRRLRPLSGLSRLLRSRPHPGDAAGGHLPSHFPDNVVRDRHLPSPQSRRTELPRVPRVRGLLPHLVAGPLTRHDQLIPQLRRISDRGSRRDGGTGSASSRSVWRRRSSSRTASAL